MEQRELPTVFITRAVPEEAMATAAGKVRFIIGPDERPATREELLDGFRQADAVVSMLNDPIDRALLEAAGPRVRVVANYAVGFNNIDFQAAAELGIWAANTPEATTDSTADLAMALMLAAGRRLDESQAELRAGRFGGWAPKAHLGLLLRGAQLGIIGMGRIGQAVAQRARAFGMRIAYFTRTPLTAEKEAELGAVRMDLRTLLATSDVVTLHCPLTPQTRHLLDASALAQMKKGALLVNTSRGPVVDEAALAQALLSGHLGGAALDVYENEPKVHPDLLKAPNALLVPHLGTSTLRTRAIMGEKAFANVLAVLEGREPPYPVNRPPHPREPFGTES